jgi:hypothetical protein
LFSDRLPEQAQSRLGNQSFFFLPLTIINQVILETAEAHAVSAEDIAGFESLAQLPVNQEFIPIRQEAFEPLRVFEIKVTLELIRDASSGKDSISILSKRLAF